MKALELAIESRAKHTGTGTLSRLMLISYYLFKPAWPIYLLIGVMACLGSSLSYFGGQESSWLPFAAFITTVAGACVVGALLVQCAGVLKGILKKSVPPRYSGYGISEEQVRDIVSHPGTPGHILQMMTNLPVIFSVDSCSQDLAKHQAPADLAIGVGAEYHPTTKPSALTRRLLQMLVMLSWSWLAIVSLVSNMTTPLGVILSLSVLAFATSVCYAWVVKCKTLNLMRLRPASTWTANSDQIG